MLTRTAFSFISYNTDAYLKLKLDALIDESEIAFWCYIKHQPEADETKAHKHLLIVPARQVDTAVIAKYLEEFEADNDLPLKSLGVRHAQFADWYLYALHDADYLASKGDERRFHYTRDEFVCSDNDYFLELIHTSDFTKWKKQAEFRDAVKRGVPFSQLLENGFIPIQQIYQYREAHKIMSDKYMPECKRKEYVDFIKVQADGTVVDIRSGEIMANVNMSRKVEDLPFVFDDGEDGGVL